MATLVLSAVLTSLATSATSGAVAAGTIAASTAGTIASVAGAIGSAVGAAIDQAYVYPALFGDAHGDSSGPRITEVQTQHALEGTPIPFVMGPRNRVPGLLIWAGKLQEKANKTGGGGGKSGGGSTTTYEYSMSIAIAVCEGKVSKIRKIWANGKKFYDSNDPSKGDSRYKSIDFFTGGTAQNPSSIIEGEEGAGSVPAFRGVCYFVVEDLELENSGNAIPQFHILVEKDEGPFAVSDGYRDVLTRGDTPLEDSQFDVSRVTGNYTDIDNELQGYVSNGPEQTDKSLEHLMIAYDNAVVERGGQLVFYDRGSEPRVHINEEDLAAVEGEGQSGPGPFTINDIEATDLPSEVNVDHIDQDNRFQRGTQNQRLQRPITDAVVTLDLPLTLTPKQARIVAKRRLYGPWNERWTFAGSLPPSYMHLETGDIMLVAYEGEVYGIRIQSIRRGANFLHMIDGLVQARTTDDGTGNLFVEQDADAESPTPDDDPDPYDPPATVTYLLDLPPLDQDHVKKVGFYWAHAAIDPSAPWKGSELKISNKPTPDDNYKLLKKTKTEHTVGEANGVSLGHLLPNGEEIDPYVFDEHSTVDVILWDGFLQSHERSEVLDGLNWAVLGEEIIAFRSAVLIGSGVNGEPIYTLSGLLRGLRATEDHMIHGATDRFILLEDPLGVEWHKLKKKELGKTRYVRDTPKGADFDAMVEQSIQVAGESSLPFPVCQVRRVDCEARGADDGEIVIEWTPRTRDVGVGLFDGQLRELPEEHVYDVRFIYSSGQVYNPTSFDGTEFTLTEADQALGTGHSPLGAPITVEITPIAKKSKRAGRMTTWVV